MALATVTVGLKTPNGLLIEHGGKTSMLNGANSASVIGGHGLTENVDKDLFEGWLERHAEMALVKMGLIFAHFDKRNAVSEAKEKSDNKSGLEQIDVSEGTKDVRAKGIKKADDK